MGWGLEPVSTEGWIVLLAFGALSFLVRRTQPRSRLVKLAMAAGFVIFLLLKGSAPGGAGARADFEAAKAAGPP